MKHYIPAAILALLMQLPSDAAPLPQIAVAQSELSGLYSQWRAAEASKPVSAMNFRLYLVGHRVASAQLQMLQGNSFTGKIAQALYVLPGGASVLGIMDSGAGGLVIQADVNGTEPPNVKGSEEFRDQKQFVINAQGQVTVSD
jgi:hypothetical protein